MRTYKTTFEQNHPVWDSVYGGFSIARSTFLLTRTGKKITISKPYNTVYEQDNSLLCEEMMNTYFEEEKDA